MDVNCFIGRWPYRKLRRQGLTDLRRLHESMDIQGGLISSLDSVFYADPLEGDMELAQAIAGSEYRWVQSINPQLSAVDDHLDAGRDLGAAAVRVYPSVHDYGFDEPALDRLANRLTRERLPLLINLRLEDIRLTYLHGYTAPDIKRLVAFLERHQDLRTVICAAYPSELAALGAVFNRGNRWTDISGLKDGLFPVEKLLSTVPVEQILFGSQYPLYTLTSSWLQVIRARLDDATRSAILSDNAARLVSD